MQKTLEEKNKFIVEHLDLARWVSLMMHRRYRHCLTIDDIYSAACLGLVMGVRHFLDDSPEQELRRQMVRCMINAVIDDARKTIRLRRRMASGIDMNGLLARPQVSETLFDVGDERDQDVLALLYAGYRRSEIGERLGLSTKTIGKSVQRLRVFFGGEPVDSERVAC